MAKAFIATFLLVVCAIDAARGDAWHEYNCNHGCASPTCVAQNIETYESFNGAACANYAPQSPAYGPSSPAITTDCSRLESLGVKTVRTTLQCAGGSCTVSGYFKCPTGSGYKQVPVNMTCLPRGGEIPSAVVEPHTYYINGSFYPGTTAVCYYSSGSQQASCDSSGTFILITSN